MKNNSGFSLIELMVVIAIVAALAVIATPLYKDYSHRVKVTNAFEKVKAVARNVAAEYDADGAMPTTITVNGFTLNRTTPVWVHVNWGDVVNAVYQGNANGVVLSTTVGGLGGAIDYIAPTSSTPNGTSHNMIHYAVRYDDGLFQYACGSMAAFPNNVINLKYQPSACNCLDIMGFVNGTADC